MRPFSRGGQAFLADRVKVVEGPADFIGIENMDGPIVLISPDDGE
jgi:hypothetical protein